MEDSFELFTEATRTSPSRADSRQPLLRSVAWRFLFGLLLVWPRVKELINLCRRIRIRVFGFMDFFDISVVALEPAVKVWLHNGFVVASLPVTAVVHYSFQLEFLVFDLTINELSEINRVRRFDFVPLPWGRRWVFDHEYQSFGKLDKLGLFHGPGIRGTFFTIRIYEITSIGRLDKLTHVSLMRILLHAEGQVWIF